MIRKIFEVIDEGGVSGLIARAVAWLGRRIRSSRQEFLARLRGSYTTGSALRLHSRLHRPDLIVLTDQQCIPVEVAEHYLAHRFDLLGSGWTQVKYGANWPGFNGHHYGMDAPTMPDSRGEWLRGRINQSNLHKAQSIWRLIDVEYRPIDWQLDFKSGFRWSEKRWAKQLVFGDRLGVDVKVPWELARMQHLPQLALRALALGGDRDEGRLLAREVQNQLLDFIAVNPPGFGVNWLCPMDVAIRAANWLMAWDILHVARYPFEASVEDIIAHSIYDHGSYITENLEWTPKRGNHYLSDICGLAFIACYLSESEVTNTWLAFAIQQLNNEVLRQFHPDGGNFEGSTAYHRLCSEMALYATALILGLPEARLKVIASVDLRSIKFLPTRSRHNGATGLVLHLNALTRQHEKVGTVFDQAYALRLAGFIDFFACILKSDGTFPQIGDNDSGRFFKFQPAYSRGSVGQMKAIYSNLESYSTLPDSAPYFLEQHLNGSHLLDAASGLGWCSPNCLLENQVGGTSRTEAAIVRALADRRTLVDLGKTRSLGKTSAMPAYHEDGQFRELWNQVTALPGSKLKAYRFPVNVNYRLHKFIIMAFSDFGFYVFRCPSIYIAIRCVGQIDQDTSTSHFHDDQLSLEMEISGQTVVADPGTFVYTSWPSDRNQYRSWKAHFVPQREEEHGFLTNDNVFSPLKIQPASVLYCGAEGFAAEVDTTDCSVGLLLKFETDAIEVLHYCKGVGMLSELDPRLPFSPGYGIKGR